jgi:hypothetical protein
MWLCWPVLTLAQKQVDHQQLIWFAYFNTLKLDQKWWLISELQERRFIHSFKPHQFLVRTHVNRELGSGWDVAAGMCLFLQSPNDPESSSSLIVPELRPHFEFNLRQKLSWITIDHRYKFEARFFHHVNEDNTSLEDGYSFGNFRARYRLQFSLPLLKIADDRYLKLKAGDEILFNLGKEVIHNFFDQNRIAIALSFDFSPDLTFEAGYLNWFQQQKSGNKYFDRDILRISLDHKIKTKRAS